MNVLEEAQTLIYGGRNADYGHPLDDFTATASFWTTWLRHKHSCDVTLEAEDVAVMMSLLKHSREGNKSKRDNKVDACGYLGTLEMIEAERVRRNGNGKRPPPPPGWRRPKVIRSTL